MKRAGRKRRDRILWLVPTAIVTVALVNLADAQSARFTLIDARDGLTPEVQAAYAEAMGAQAQNPHVRSRIKIIADPRIGAAFEAVPLPEHVRNVDLSIDLILKGSHPVEAPVEVNHLHLARRAPLSITQSTSIRGQ